LGEREQPRPDLSEARRIRLKDARIAAL
jgi:hypothetical protein